MAFSNAFVVLLLVASLVFSCVHILPRHRNHSPRRVRRSATTTSNGCIVWVLLGDPHFQPYIWESIVQARLWNPDAALHLLIDPTHIASNPVWAWNAKAYDVVIANASTYVDDYYTTFSARYAELWRLLAAHKTNSMMLPTINDKTNMDFTSFTMVRLVILYNYIYRLQLMSVVHLENDQMIYHSIDAIQRAASFCKVSILMTRLGKRLSPAANYFQTPAALKELLDFILEHISQGMGHAIQVANTVWVTDMSITASYFDMHRHLRHANVSTFPHAWDDSCFFEQSKGLVFDALPLGTWCCGSFVSPRSHFKITMDESATPYWAFPFAWQLKSLHSAQTKPLQFRDLDGKLWAGAELRVPVWNNTPVFNLHMHSKQLHLFRSTDAAIPRNAYGVVRSKN